jgi:hypothetical protein
MAGIEIKVQSSRFKVYGSKFKRMFFEMNGFSLDLLDLIPFALYLVLFPPDVGRGGIV